MSIYVKQTSGTCSLLPDQPVSGKFKEADATAHPIQNGYQLYKLGRLVIFSVTDYKKLPGRINSPRRVGTLPEDFRPISYVRFPISTTGGETDHTTNPGNGVMINTDGSVLLVCNHDTGNYCSWNGCFISKY